MHLFGIARFKSMAEFAGMGVRSVDSASYLRQAWIRDQQGYLSIDGPYASIRIPEVGKSFRAKRMLAEEGIEESKAKLLEAAALQAIRSCDGSAASVRDTLAHIKEYDLLFGATRKDHSMLYERTLTDQPWKKCPCDICRKYGVEVVIFRGNNRNRRRGFHNTFVFYHLLQRFLMGEKVSFGGSEEDTESPQLTLFEEAVPV